MAVDGESMYITCKMELLNWYNDVFIVKGKRSFYLYSHLFNL